MYSNKKLLDMLSSEKASTRYDACEWLRVRQESSPEIVRALQRATYDENKEVAERAKYALEADTHHRMAVKMGIAKPEMIDSDQNYPLENTNPIITRKSQEKDPYWRLFIAIGIITIIGGIGMLSNIIYTHNLITRSKSWPTTIAEVVSVSVKDVSSKEKRAFSPIITYQYLVSGINYNCTMRLDSKSREIEAVRITQTFVVGSQIMIHYDLNNPQTCVSVYDETPKDNLYVSIAFICFGILFVAIPSQRKREDR
jgi:hypothetical protein